MKLPISASPNPHSVCAALRHARKSLCSRVDQTAGAPDGQFVEEFPALVHEIEAGFRREQLVMELFGLPHLSQRLEEDAIILRALHRVTPAVEQGDLALGREVVATLRDLLDLHRLTADLALAVAISSPAIDPQVPRARQTAAPVQAARHLKRGIARH